MLDVGSASDRLARDEFLNLGGRARLVFRRSLWILVQEFGERQEELHANGIAIGKNVIPVFQGHQPGAGNQGCDPTPLFEGDNQIAAAMYDQSGDGDLGRQCGDVDIEVGRQERGSVPAVIDFRSFSARRRRSDGVASGSNNAAHIWR